MIDIQEVLKIEMKSKGLTYAGVAEKIGWTMQNVWDKLNNRVSPNFASIARIAAGVEMRLDIRKKDGSDLDFDVKALLGAVELATISYADLENILDAMGLEIVLLVTPEKS